MLTQNINAIILSRKNIGEADRLLSAFSLEEGKIKIIAKGSRKIKSKMASHIEPFTIGKYHLVTGKTFYILTGAEKTYYNESLTSNIESYQDTSYLCELIDLTYHENQPHQDIYNLLSETLKLLTMINHDKKEVLLRYFEFQLLKSLGYNPNYKKCIKCNKAVMEQDVFFGGFEGISCKQCKAGKIKINKNTLKILRLFQDNDLDKIINIKEVGKQNQHLKEVILPYLYDILPRKPKSYEF